jgi:predicted nucleic acid-binding protein
LARFLDSSVVLRYLTDDDAERARRAQSIIESEDLVLSCVILSEIAFVLRSTYRKRQADIADTLANFLFRDNIDLVDAEKEHVANALLKSRDNPRLSLGDALILAQMQASGHDEIYSFDTRFRDEGITVLDRPAK